LYSRRLHCLICHNAKDLLGTKRVVINDKVFFLEDTLDRDDVAIVVIKIEDKNSVFSLGRHNVYALERIITVARSHFTNSVKIPVAWRPYHDKSLLSIYTTNRSRESHARVNFDMNPDDVSSLFVFATTVGESDLSQIPRDIGLFVEARSDLTAAVLEPDSQTDEQSRAGIVLSTRLPQGFQQGYSLEDWYNSKLTAHQLQFVDKAHDGPVRLRGVAGTGKTLSLIIKALRDAQAEDKAKKHSKYGFITHSLASVDMVSAISESLDHTGLLSGGAEYASIELHTLYDLAHQYLKFDLADVQPLSLDGREGRKLQFELITSMLT